MLDKLIARIRLSVVEVGDCWEWRGALQHNAPTPTIRWEEKVGSVRRFIAIEQGKLVKGKYATCKCRNNMCVNPDHVTLVTRKRLQELIADESGYANNPTRTKKIAEVARARGKLTVELVAAIREAPGTQRAIAKQYGVGQSTISAIMRGKTWREYSNPFAGLLGIKK